MVAAEPGSAIHLAGRSLAWDEAKQGDVPQVGRRPKDAGVRAG